jgi:general secretion pathway protein K
LNRHNSENLPYPFPKAFGTWQSQCKQPTLVPLKQVQDRKNRIHPPLRDQRGMALVVTLLALVLITALVVEFSYGVYTSTNALYNWRDSQRLSLMARSGVNVSARFLSDLLDTYSYSSPGSLELPVENPFEDFEGVILVRMEDETAKFNVNALIHDNGNFNEDAHRSFKRLLEILSLSDEIADRVADYIDQDSESRISGSESGAANSALLSTDELLLIHGIRKEDYDTLVPYITVYGDRNTAVININGADVPVLMSILDTGMGDFPITEDLAKRIIAYRENLPFEDIPQFNSFAGTSLSSNQITVKGTFFSIKSIASSSGVMRIIETVISKRSLSPPVISYWKEY